MVRGRPPGKKPNVSKDVEPKESTQDAPKTRSRAGKISGVDAPPSLSGDPDVEMQDSMTLPPRAAKQAAIANPPWTRKSTPRKRKHTESEKKPKDSSSSSNKATLTTRKPKTNKAERSHTSRSAHRYRAPAIDVEESSSEHESSDEGPPTKLKKLDLTSNSKTTPPPRLNLCYTAKTNKKTEVPNPSPSDENEYNEDGEDSGGSGKEQSDSDEFEDNRDDGPKVEDLFNEAPQWVNDNGNLSMEVSSEQTVVRSMSRRRDIKQSDDESDAQALEPESPTPNSKSMKPKKKAAYQKKLEDEMPLITDKPKKKPVARKPTGDTIVTSGSLTGAAVTPILNKAWLPRTGIVIHFEGKTPTIQMKAQNTVIADVLRLSFEIGKIKMACDSKYSPMALGGLEKIAADALVAAADKLKYDGENDIADRLECEKEQDSYLIPMRNYCLQRLTKARTGIKHAALPIVPMFFGVSKSDQAELTLLMTDTNYIFPRNVPENRNEPFDEGQPFANPIIAAVLRSFLTSYLSPKAIVALSFTSSIKTSPSELEVSDAMVALSATAIHAVLSDIQRDTLDEFTSGYWDTVYQDHMAVLSGLRSKKPNFYHTIMHNLYKNTTGKHQIAAVSQNDAIKRVKWDMIPD